MLAKIFGTSIITFVVAIVSIFTISVALPTASALAAGCGSNDKGILSADSTGLPQFGCGDDTSIIQTIMQLVFGGLALASLLFIVIGGFKYTISGGDGNAIASAKKTIIYAVIGLVLGVSVFTITGFVFSWAAR